MRRPVTFRISSMRWSVSGLLVVSDGAGLPVWSFQLALVYRSGPRCHQAGSVADGVDLDQSRTNEPPRICNGSRLGDLGCRLLISVQQ